MKIEFEDGESIHLNVPLAFTSEKPWQTLLEDRLLLAMAKRIQEMVAYQRQGDSAQEVIFTREYLLGGGMLTPTLVRDILMAYNSGIHIDGKQSNDEQRD